MINRLEIPTIDVEAQIAKGVDDNVKSFYAAASISVAVPWRDDAEGASLITAELNRYVEESFPDGVTPDILGEGSWYEININAHTQRREAIFRGLGGITTLDLLESVPTGYNIDYFRKTTVNDAGEPRVKSDWGLGRDLPPALLEMFDLTPPTDDEVALPESSAACFVDNGEYFFPVFQFGYNEGDSGPFYIQAVERVLGLESKYPSTNAMLNWIHTFNGTEHPLHEFILEENFNPDKLWDIFWEGLGYNPRLIFGGPSELRHDDGRPRMSS